MGDTDHRQPIRRKVLRVAVALGVVVVAIQFVPYGWTRTNPPVTGNAPWPDEGSAAIARESCYSCHSNETDWPIYSYVAPMSWLVRSDVETGRDELNFSTWPEDDGELDDAIEQIQDGEMPPQRYTGIHRGAALTSTEEDELIAALVAMDEQR